MFSTKLLRDAAGEAYIDSRPQLIGICKKFKERYGGDLDDLISEADEHFTDIFLTHDPDRADFKSDVGFRVWKRLLETKEREANRNRKLPRVKFEDYPEREPPPPFNFDEFTSGLSLRTKLILHLALNPPPDVQIDATLSSDIIDGYSPNNLRVALLGFLRDVGWARNAVLESFREVREFLS